MSRLVDGVYVVSDSFDVDHYSFEGTADQIKAFLDNTVARATEMGMVGEGRFDFDITQDYYDSYDLTVKYYFDRRENDRERERREKAEAKRKADAAEKRKKTAEKKKLKADAEYAEFLRLKEKFKQIEG
jgi:hypothetical protein